MFSPATCEALKWYVYLLKDNEDNIFYVGKGRNNRVFNHINDAFNNPHINHERFDRIRELGKDNIQHIIVRHGLDENIAFEVEGALIDLYGLNYLVNIQNGHYNTARGMQPDTELEIRYGAEPIDIVHRVFLGMISNNYDPFTTSNEEVYEICRKWWRVNPSNHTDAEYCLAVHNGIVRGVFTINDWEYAELPYCNPNDEGRYAFIGEIAEPDIVNRYRHKDIRLYVTQNRKWINC